MTDADASGNIASYDAIATALAALERNIPRQTTAAGWLTPSFRRGIDAPPYPRSHYRPTTP